MAGDARAAAARALGKVLGGQSLNQALPDAVASVQPRDQALVQQLCYGAARFYPRLAGVLAQLLDKPLRDKDRDVQALLVIGLYQLQSMRIPDHAAVAATVAATRTLKKPWAKGLTNAVLRRYQREHETLLAELEPAAERAHPEWLYQSIAQQWPKQAQDLLAANNEQPGMCLRVNSTRHSVAEYLKQLSAAGIEASASMLSPDGIRLQRPVDVGALPGFFEGAVSVQDEAAQVAARLLDPQPGERVLDACAAPGGKACHILERQPQLAELVALDADEHRLVRITENLQRLALQATLHCADAAAPDLLEAASFDRILVDAPCSATGVIRRHPDVKLLRRQADIPQLADQQLAILNGLWPLLKSGGMLVYATCSILEEENSEVIGRFIAQHSDVDTLPPSLSSGLSRQYGLQLLPQPGGHDGLYYACMRKH